MAEKLTKTVSDIFNYEIKHFYSRGNWEVFKLGIRRHSVSPQTSNQKYAF